MNNKLLPCPFCGADVSAPEKINSKGKPKWKVQCSQFCISMIRGTKKELIQDWNCRKKGKL